MSIFPCCSCKNGRAALQSQAEQASFDCEPEGHRVLTWLAICFMFLQNPCTKGHFVKLCIDLLLQNISNLCLQGCRCFFRPEFILWVSSGTCVSRYNKMHKVTPVTLKPVPRIPQIHELCRTSTARTPIAKPAKPDGPFGSCESEQLRTFGARSFCAISHRLGQTNVAFFLKCSLRVQWYPFNSYSKHL